MYLLVVLSGFFIFLSSLGLKKNRADGAGRYLNLTFVVGIASVISWSVTLIMRESVTKDMFLFALPFSALFVLGMIYGYKAYESGSMTVTALFGNAYLVPVAVFGILAYSEPVTPFKVLGIVGVLIALTLLTFSEGADQEADKPQEKKKFNVKWLLYCMGMIVTNTLLSVLAKVRQERVGGVNPFAYMALCYTFTFVLSAITYAFLQIKNRTFQRDFFNAKESAVSIGLQSFGNSAANLLVMFLISRVDVSIVYPVETGVALVLSACCGFVFFKEKKTAQKLFGIVLGIVAIVILSI